MTNSYYTGETKLTVRDNLTEEKLLKEVDYIMIKYSEEVLNALKENKPIVALESTILLMVCHIQQILKWQ